MKYKIKLMVSLMFLFGLMGMVIAAGQKITTSVSSGVLDAVDQGDGVVVFNGLKYTYKLNEKQSVLALDESGMSPIKIRDLKVGQKYFFERVSYVEDPQPSQFKDIVFISDTQPTVTE